MFSAKWQPLWIDFNILITLLFWGIIVHHYHHHGNHLWSCQAWMFQSMPFDNFEAIYSGRHSVVVIQSVTVVVTIVVRSPVYLSNGKYTQSGQLTQCYLWPFWWSAWLTWKPRTVRLLGCISQTFMGSYSKSCKNLYCSYMKNAGQIRSQLCTSHDSSAQLSWRANLCPDWFTEIMIKAKIIFIWVHFRVLEVDLTIRASQLAGLVANIHSICRR